MRVSLVLVGLCVCLVAPVASAKGRDHHKRTDHRAEHHARADHHTRGHHRAPEEQTVCDSLRGATHGLRGLCVAYCRVQDYCDAFDGAPGGKCDLTSNWLLKRYERRRLADDPPMPCLAPPPPPPPLACPCYSAEDLDALQPDFCIDDVQPDGESLFVGNIDFDVGAGSSVWSGQPECVFIDPAEVFTLEINAEESAECTALLESAIETNGLVCDQDEGF